jgi:hypothetical protein
VLLLLWLLKRAYFRGYSSYVIAKKFIKKDSSMKHTIYLFLFSASFLFGTIVMAETESHSWNLPIELSDANTKVRFELDSTWHLVHGAVSGVEGSVALGERERFDELALSLTLPVGRFDTENSTRDKKMRRVMSAAEYPRVSFTGGTLQHGCTPSRVLAEGECKDSLSGKLTILKTTLAVELPTLIKADSEGGYVITGSLPIDWAFFGVEDPSILIASVDPIVTIFYEVRLPATTEAKASWKGEE